MTIAGIFDPHRERANALADQCGARVAKSIEALAQFDAEIASVCGPPAVHVEHAECLSAAARGASRITFVEKPVAVSLPELERLRKLEGCVPVVQWRAGRAIRAVRRAVAQGEFGDRPVVSCDLAWGRSDSYVSARNSNWGCGAILSVGVHALDAVLWALGRRPTEAIGRSIRREGAHAETSAAGMISFEGGALLSFRISFDGGADSTRLMVCGRGVTAVIEGGEGDPTASSVRWMAESSQRIRSLEQLERETAGATASPLIVPYVGDALAAVREGRFPGDTARLPSIGDVFESHAVAIRMGHAAGTATNGAEGVSQ